MSTYQSSSFESDKKSDEFSDRLSSLETKTEDSRKLRGPYHIEKECETFQPTFGWIKRLYHYHVWILYKIIRINKRGCSECYQPCSHAFLNTVLSHHPYCVFIGEKPRLNLISIFRTTPRMQNNCLPFPRNSLTIFLIFFQKF